jgi:hypothetical protein
VTGVSELYELEIRWEPDYTEEQWDVIVWTSERSGMSFPDDDLFDALARARAFLIEQGESFDEQ